MAGLSQLKSALQRSVVELIYIRRRPYAGVEPTRRALATTNLAVLNSELGRDVLGYRPPTGYRQPYSLNAYNLVVAWDILKQDYRQYDVPSSTIVTEIDVTTPEQLQQWWEYFYENVLPMSPQQKVAFINS